MATTPIVDRSDDPSQACTARLVSHRPSPAPSPRPRPIEREAQEVAASVPLAKRPTSMQKLVLNRLHVLVLTRSALELGHRHSVRPGYFEETRGPPRLLGHPLHTCRGSTPRRNQPLLAPSTLEKIHAEAGIAFTQLRTLGNRNDVISRPLTHGPHVHAPTHRQPRYRRPAAQSSPARRCSRRAGRGSRPQ